MRIPELSDTSDTSDTCSKGKIENLKESALSTNMSSDVSGIESEANSSEFSHEEEVIYEEY